MSTVDICPSICASYAEEYGRQIERVVPFAKRLHLDISDGIFTPNKLLAPSDLWWPGGVRADVHVMYKRPVEVIDSLIALGPSLVILHAEAEGDFMFLAKKLRFHGIQAGISLLPSTPVSYILPGLDFIDHVLLFSGDLGHFGGAADLGLLEKAREIRLHSHRTEIGWDGGVTDKNVAAIAQGGVEMIVSGGYIQKASNPEEAYATLKTLAI